jgi:protease I
MSEKNVLFLVGDYAEDYEAMVPYQALEMVGCDVDTVCPEKTADDEIRTAVHDTEEGVQTYSEKPGHRFQLNANFDAVDVSDYDGLLITGGRAPEYLRMYDEVLDLVRAFDDAGKPVGAVCHGVQILAAAGVIDGRRCTSYPGLESEMVNAGADWVDAVVRDGNLVTARGYHDHPDWLREFLDSLGLQIDFAGSPAVADD